VTSTYVTLVPEHMSGVWAGDAHKCQYAMCACAHKYMTWCVCVT